MMLLSRRKIQYVVSITLVLLLASATYALAAANTVPASKAGDGSGVISGYTVSNIHYDLNPTTPSDIDSVTFTLDTAPVAASTITIKLEAAGSTWYSCTNIAAAVTCTTTGASVLAADELHVVIAD